MNIQKSWKGHRAAHIAGGAGVVGLIPTGTLAHQVPTANRLDRGSGLIGDQRVRPSLHVHTLDTPLKTLQVTFIDADGDVRLEACEGDPNAGPWYEVEDGELTTSGVIEDNAVRRYTRVRVENAGGGVVVHLNASN